MKRRFAAPALVPALWLCLAALAVAADLQEHTARAYDSYSEHARHMFLERIRRAAAPDGTNAGRTAMRDAEVRAGPAAQDGVIAVPGGLVHHWSGSTFIADATLQHALAVSCSYDEYHAVYDRVLSSRLLGRDGNTYHVLTRIKESGAGLTAVLDVTTRTRYSYPDSRSAFSISTSEEIRELRDAGTPKESSLLPGHDSGYLWRAATFTSFLEQDEGGVLVEMEVIGLSRGFPPVLGLIIEPIARQLGRNSVERSLQEFGTAVRTRVRHGTSKEETCDGT